MSLYLSVSRLKFQTVAEFELHIMIACPVVSI